MRSKLGSVFPCIIALVTACSRPPNEANADNATPSPQKTMTIEENKRKNEAAILQHGGGKTFVNRWQELLESYQNPIDYEVRDLSITAGDDVAFSHSLNRVSGTMKSGQKSDRWLRWTACYRKTNGKWLIVHEHVSVPVDLGNGKAMLDLKPYPSNHA